MDKKTRRLLRKQIRKELDRAISGTADMVDESQIPPEAMAALQGRSPPRFNKRLRGQNQEKLVKLLQDRLAIVIGDIPPGLMLEYMLVIPVVRQQNGFALETTNIFPEATARNNELKTPMVIGLLQMAIAQLATGHMISQPGMIVGPGAPPDQDDDGGPVSFGVS